MYSLLDKIGNTPLVEIKRLNPNPEVQILAKLEYFNPGGSIKDRTALCMIETGETDGTLTPDKIILEATSGNTGIGLAMVCAIKGYSLLLTMSEGASVERRKILKAMGAELYLTPVHLGTDGAIEEAYRLARENPDKYFLTDQFNSAANWSAHYHGTAEEIWSQTGGQVTAVVATLGTTGTIMGISRRLKEHNSTIQIIGVEPYLGHKIQGLKNMREAYRPEIYKKNRLDKKLNIEDDEAFDMARQLAGQEGLFVGMSSGAAMVAAQQVAKEMEHGTLVVIFPDSGERYLSTPLFAVKEVPSLRFYNTMTRSKEPFTPLQPGRVSIYSCGPTVDDYIDIGLARRFVAGDLLIRYLEYKGYEVTHVINITDLDDRTIQGSESAGMDLKPFTEKYTKAFFEDIEAIGIKPATEYPKASDHVEDIVKLARRLLEKGMAYEKLKSVYFDISRCSGYGKLSKLDLNKIKVGSTVDLDDYEKENPRDFTLLKRAKLSELKRGIYTKTEWGSIQPGWHIECAAMAMKYLGESFDIHTSSRALIFPHHENEIAICESLTGKPLARYWLHSDQVRTSSKNVNSSEEDRVTIRELLRQGYAGREIRFWLLSNHYRKPLHYSDEALQQARRSVRKLDEYVDRLNHLPHARPYQDIDQLTYNLKQEFGDAMDDDLNISAALSAIFKFIKQINKLIAISSLDRSGANSVLDTLKTINMVFNVFNFESQEFAPEILALLQERNIARNRKDWVRADEIRDILRSKGIMLKDTPTGSVLNAIL
ncbi:MAG: cysteine--tRNA ligase [Deltaproteobacteria bacterium]|jgi:cysteinyl-tRNA synthetase|nr:cysteine--tRNA ligase [Deltaproteobacteria bacterium]